MLDRRREEVIKLLISNPEMTAEQAMIKVGYSLAYAHSSTNLTGSKSFKEKLNEVIKDESLIATIRAILNRRIFVTQDFDTVIDNEYIINHIERKGGEFPEIKVLDVPDFFYRREGRKKIKVETIKHVKQVSYYVPDEEAVDRMLDKLFKLRGDYAPEKKEVRGIVAVTQLLDELQNDDGTIYKPLLRNGKAESITT